MKPPKCLVCGQEHWSRQPCPATKIHVGPIAENRWLAATLEAPYFCLEAESREALFAKTKRALAFCRDAKEYIRHRCIIWNNRR